MANIRSQRPLGGLKMLLVLLDSAQTHDVHDATDCNCYY